MVTTACRRTPQMRLSGVLKALGVARSVWYARAKSEPRRPGRKGKPVPEALAHRVRAMAHQYPWWGYERIGVVARRGGVEVSNKQAYKVMKAVGLLQKRRVRSAEHYQGARLFELLPSAPNGLWQADVTYIHISGHHWWNAVTVIDYYSRYLLACHFKPSYRATDVNAALDAAQAEAERVHGALAKPPFLVTDNGSSFLARSLRRHITTITPTCVSGTARRPSPGCSSACTEHWRARRCTGSSMPARARRGNRSSSSAGATTRYARTGRCPPRGRRPAHVGRGVR